MSISDEDMEQCIKKLLELGRSNRNIIEEWEHLAHKIGLNYCERRLVVHLLFNKIPTKKRLAEKFLTDAASITAAQKNLEALNVCENIRSSVGGRIEDTKINKDEK